jgi:hypothetical protein
MEDDLCEVPFSPSPLARDLTKQRLLPDAAGYVSLPERPGLGLDIDLATVRQYLVEVDIQVDGAVLFHSSAELLDST